MILHLSQSWPGAQTPELHQQQSGCPHSLVNILGGGELRSAKELLQTYSTNVKQNASFPFLILWLLITEEEVALLLPF